MESMNIKKWFVYIWMFLFCSVPLLFAEEYKEPEIEKVFEWRPHFALGLVLAYHIDGLRVEFAHPLMANFQDSKCNEFQSDTQRIVIVLGGPKAWRYEALRSATAYRVAPGEWQPIITKTR